MSNQLKPTLMKCNECHLRAPSKGLCSAGIEIVFKVPWRTTARLYWPRITRSCLIKIISHSGLLWQGVETQHRRLFRQTLSLSPSTSMGCSHAAKAERAGKVLLPKTDSQLREALFAFLKPFKEHRCRFFLTLVRRKAAASLHVSL